MRTLHIYSADAKDHDTQIVISYEAFILLDPQKANTHRAPQESCQPCHSVRVNPIQYWHFNLHSHLI